MMDRRGVRLGVMAAGLVLGLWVFGSPVVADDREGHRGRSLEERQHLRADMLRRRAQEDLRDRLRYEPVYPYGEYRRGPVDSWALSQQISRLSAMLERLTNRIAPGVGVAGVPRPPDRMDGPGGSDLATVYGPDGPTERSVRLLLEYRLMVGGNPRLKIGSVRDEGEVIVAEVVTVDDSLVDAYRIDKKSGVWEPVR